MYLCYICPAVSLEFEHGRVVPASAWRSIDIGLMVLYKLGNMLVLFFLWRDVLCYDEHTDSGYLASTVNAGLFYLHFNVPSPAPGSNLAHASIWITRCIIPMTMPYRTARLQVLMDIMSFCQAVIGLNPIHSFRNPIFGSTSIRDFWGTR